MKLVDFMIIGAMKSGTTSLAHLLSRHPDICFCVSQEPDYFSKNKDWKRNIDKYHKLFKDKHGQLLGEASTMYTMLPENEGTAERIKEYNPYIKLIYIVRHPLERVRSHFAHNFVRKRISTDLQSILMKDPSYLNRSKYYYQLSHYYELFDPSQIKVVVFEDFVRDSKKVLVEISEFLNIDPIFFLSFDTTVQMNSSTNRRILADGGIGRIFNPLKKIRHKLPEYLVNLGLLFFGNEIKERPKLSPELQQYVINELQTDILDFQKLIKRDLSSVWNLDFNDFSDFSEEATVHH